MELNNGILGRRYELIERIGGGGMADVYKAHDIILDRIVAVKILHDQLANDGDFLAKFQKEAKDVARLSHPNIVNVFDVGVDGSKHYIVMEYVAGRTLKKLIGERGNLSVKEAVNITRQIAGALAHAHENKLVHCDIKSHNILVMPGGEVKVADFGIARVVSETTMTYNSTVVGSVHYLSPEQAKGTVITEKTDIYSLGVVFYEMLTGVLPFNGETTVSIALKHLQDEPVPPREVKGDIPSMVETVVLKLLSKKLTDRPEAKNLANELSRIEAVLGYNLNMQEEEDEFATKVMKPVHVEDYADYDDIDDETGEENQPIYKSKKMLLISAGVLIISFVLGMFFFYGKFWSNAEVVVPDVTGKQMTLARQVLEAQNLRVNVVETFDAKITAGIVISQSPEAKTSVKERRVVTIYVSKGGEEVIMPDLNGLSRQLAEEKINRMGLRIGSIYNKFSNSEQGTVLEQEPRAGSKINQGTMVDLTVSKGKENQTVTVPDLKNMPIDAAKAKLASLKLKVGSVTQQESATREGLVIRQGASAGSQLVEGSAVDLVISVAAKTEDRNGKQPAATDGKTPNRTNNNSGKSDK